MKKAKIIHNPTAGKETHSEADLKSALEEHGYKYTYCSTKEKGWKDIDEDTEFIVVAGGDGTIRKTAVKVLNKLDWKKLPPIALLPLGTANNISKALGIKGNPSKILGSIDKTKTQAFDVGRVEGLEEKEMFLESFGFGVFPKLIKEMRDHPVADSTSPEKKIAIAQQILRDIISKYEAPEFEVTIDETIHKGKYLLAEIMNTGSIGPNLNISPTADTSDGKLEVILIPEASRDEFADYVGSKLSDTESEFHPQILSGEKIIIRTDCKHLHVDDELKDRGDSEKIKVEVDKGFLTFLKA